MTYGGYLAPLSEVIRPLLREGRTPLSVAISIVGKFPQPRYWADQTEEWKINATKATISHAFRDDIPKRVQPDTRENEAVDLRASGLTLREIARRLGYAHPERPRQLIAKAERRRNHRMRTAFRNAYNAVYIMMEPTPDAFPIGVEQTWTPERQFDCDPASLRLS